MGLLLPPYRLPSMAGKRHIAAYIDVRGKHNHSAVDGLQASQQAGHAGPGSSVIVIGANQDRAQGRQCYAQIAANARKAARHATLVTYDVKQRVE